MGSEPSFDPRVFTPFVVRLLCVTVVVIGVSGLVLSTGPFMPPVSRWNSGSHHPALPVDPQTYRGTEWRKSKPSPPPSPWSWEALGLIHVIWALVLLAAVIGLIKPERFCRRL